MNLPKSRSTWLVKAPQEKLNLLEYFQAHMDLKGLSMIRSRI